MRRKINYVNGMPVEISLLDETGEEERRLLNELALHEYNDTGTLSSAKLREANAQFLRRAREHILREEPEQE